MVGAAFVSAIVIQTIAFTNVARGTSSHVNEPRQVVVRTEADWQAFWKTHSSEPAPKVDFGKSIVVGVFLGTRPTAGYTVAITAVRRTADGAVVEYTEGKPTTSRMSAQVLTSPFILIAIPRDVQKIEFTSKTP